MIIDDISEKLSQYNVAQQKKIKEAHQRSLPFNELITDRWERARFLGFGEGASIYNSAYIYGDVYAGESTWIGPNVILDGSGGGITIGSFCSISAGVHIYTHDTIEWALSGGLCDKFRAKVSIGDRCHIGAQSIIKAGIHIGNQCVIGANTFVNKDIPDASIVVGSPARIIGRVVVNGSNIQFEYIGK